MENPGLVKEIKPIVINFNIENIDQFALGNYNNFFNFKTHSGDELIKIIEYLDQRRKEAANQEILNCYNPSTLPYNAIRKLIDNSFLETDHNGTHWLHPLVQKFSYEDLKNKKEAHMVAVKYYLSFPLPENPTKIRYSTINRSSLPRL